MMTKLTKNIRGFTLVEIIVVIAIIAVLTGVLAPAMLAYAERARAQRDDSAMGEMTNAVMLAMCSEQEIFDEVMYYSTYGNISCYVDEKDSNLLTDIEITREADSEHKAQFKYGDTHREKDETVYYVAGNMRGVTITFEPGMRYSKQEFFLENAVINKYVQDTIHVGMNTSDLVDGIEEGADDLHYINDAPDYVNTGTLGTMKAGSAVGSRLFYRLKSMFGENILLKSQTYRNSEYTVFIRLGTNGGFSEGERRAMVVYGQWNGTNLPYYAVQQQN